MLNKFFDFFRKSDDELRKEFVVREIDNNDEVPAYEDSNVALYEEVRQVANIKHACELDAECIDCLEDYGDLIVRLLAFADVRKFTMQCAYDLIISNPPFFVNSFKCDEDRRNQARHTDSSLTFSELISAVRRLLKPDGRLVVVLPYRESQEFIPLAAEANLFVHRCENIIPTMGKTPNRVNLEFRYGNQETVETADLVIRTADGQFTDDYNRVVSDFYLG